MEMKIWFVDDRQDNHTTWLNSFPEQVLQRCELRSFISVPDALAQFADGHLPDILFLDFFIGGRLGIEIVRWFDNQETRPVLIAHSSMREANEGMVREGADFFLEKHKNRPHTESVKSTFTCLDDVLYVATNRALRENA